MTVGLYPMFTLCYNHIVYGFYIGVVWENRRPGPSVRILTQTQSSSFVPMFQFHTGVDYAGESMGDPTTQENEGS